MGKLKVEKYVVGPVQTNCYFAVNADTKEILVIDPGESPDYLAQKIETGGYRPAAILLTHGHFDHAAGAESLAKHFGIPVYAHEEEKAVLESEEKNASWMIGESRRFCADLFLKDEQELELAGFHIRVLYTPGHTIGGCCYYFPYEETVFSGDTLFSGSVGRTDLPTGSMAQLVGSIKKKLVPLPDKTAVYPGHGEETTMEAERMYNPYL